MNTHRVPNIPRSEWAAHPRFATQALLLGSHANFRRVSAYLVEAAENGRDHQRIGTIFRRWKQAMRGHENYEERKLYPYLSRRWGVSFDDAEEGHEELAVHDRAVRAALDCGEGVAAALRGHHEVLIEHLALEEDMVMPLLLSLTPEEFEAYSNSWPG